MNQSTMFQPGLMIGQRILAEALDRGYHVTAFVRDPAAETTQHKNLVVKTADILNSCPLR